MILADAIEAWGRRYRRHLDEPALEKLAVVWRTVRSSEVGRRQLTDMDKHDARTVMLLFDEDDRTGIAELLNTIRTWAIENPPDDSAAFDPEATSRAATATTTGAVDVPQNLIVAESDSGALLSALDGTEGARVPPVAVIDDSTATPIVVAPYTDFESAPAPTAAPLDSPAPSGDPLVGVPPPTLQAPTRAQRPAANRVPQPLPAPLGFEQDRTPPPTWMLAAGAAAVVAVLLIIFLFTRGGEDPASTDGQVETGVTQPVETDQLDLGTISTDG